ncbi:MAG: PEP-CTERM system TPR-repeat protein PrsT [Betaproteobacteria bacterium]|nr:PEP-CTERM system TPR-repeat protein PrsT [Betaproteobacteria bacterium]
MRCSLDKRPFRSKFIATALQLLIALALVSCGGANPDQQLEAAKARAAKGELAAAVIELKSLLQEHPEHAESRLYLGLIYSETGDYHGAEKELRRALELRIEPARVLPTLGKVLVLQGDARKVLAEISADATQEPEALAGILAARGLAHIALRQPGEARASFDKALALKTDHVDARLGNARLLAGEGNIEDALGEVDRALVTAPKSTEGLMLRADLFRAGRRMDDARSAYLSVVENHPGHVEALLALTSLAIATGKLDEANGHVASVRKAAPGNAMASYFEALIHFRKGDFKAARDAIGSVLKVAPKHLPSVLVGGAVEFALGSQELAQSRLRYVLERAPANAYARRLLIASYARAGQTHKALELLNPVLKKGTKDPAILALAGEVHMQLNDYERAKKFFEQAAALDPKNAAMRTGLGLSQLAAGDVDAATAELQSASALDGDRYHADVLLISTHLQRRQYAQALKAARALESKQPSNPMTYNLLAAAYIGSNDIPAARRSLEKSLALQPGYTPAALNLAQLDLQEGNKAAARKRFEDMIARDRSNVQAYIALASLGPRIDAKPSEIQAWLEAARREGPGTIQPLVMLARFYLQSGEPKKALELMEQALIGAPDNPEVLELTGQVQLAAGEKNRALATFSKWGTIQPASAQAAFRMAIAQLANEDSTAATNSLRRALSNRPEFPEAQVMLADVAARNGRRDEALKIAQELQRQNTKSPVGWIVEGDILMLEKRFGHAVTAYQKAYSLSKSGPIAMKLHSALVQEGKSNEGESKLKEWLKFKPDDVPVRLYLAEHYLKGMQYQKAIGEYEFLLSNYPENLVVLNNLAWCYQQTKDARAVEIAGKALRLEPENAAVIDTMGWILVEHGDVQRGVELLRKASALAPKTPQIRYHYAQGLAKAGERTKAKEELERLLLDFPKFPGSGEAMKRLADLRGR